MWVIGGVSLSWGSTVVWVHLCLLCHLLAPNYPINVGSGLIGSQTHVLSLSMLISKKSVYSSVW